LVKEKRFLLTAITLFPISVLFTSSLFSMMISTRRFTQLADSDPYFIQQASVQEEKTDEEPAGEANRSQLCELITAGCPDPLSVLGLVLRWGEEPPTLPPSDVGAVRTDDRI